ncbi:MULTISPECIES: DUF3592 domain-containing protein [Tenebrionibacter/Tenebrionicola group]|jgi:hypothetical protein|uniref:DUF3592 domain-containing protein n=2 Tax=Tenebrionibacter/Tenebrionicola group TaxID=2969848 RepID=A0A8K0V685_9ENTR|nr:MULTISPECIES: DUF3592 domain-containing protein [Tenebrionibacter/Tenebrionicola group]MBK4715754.1 DUF3592 domain-containing protein [Tenebrionibacter intestinalis]MBV4413884.1 DUF3592 domain-containing protein [Tenebrionicola larvae]MBV5096334.1 DUF3592 domain-containing protein [Tenebrionicola larvae]
MKRISTLCLFFGCLMLGFAFWQAWSEKQFEDNALRTTGKVIDLGLDRSEGRRIWYPVVSFHDQYGRQQEFTSSIGSSGYRSMLGQNIEVLYLAQEPQNARIRGYEGQYISSLVAGILGVGLALTGALPMLLLHNRQSRIERLLHEGWPVEATILGAVINASLAVNGQPPWRIVCQFVDKNTRKTYLFHSQNIYFDPSPWIKNRKQTVVYIDRNNVKQYLVDISWLPDSILKEKNEPLLPEMQDGLIK